jgi:hypothetical protein
MQVLEEIRVGLELNDYAMQQQRHAHMRFLGELYNYEYIDSSVIFETLNLLTVFGHGTPEVSCSLIKPYTTCHWYHSFNNWRLAYEVLEYQHFI